MSLETLKQQIVATVDASENEALLQDILEILTQRSSTVEDKELTRLCMLASEKSLAKAWENEDDAYWESFLKD